MVTSIVLNKPDWFKESLASSAIAHLEAHDLHQILSGYVDGIILVSDRGEKLYMNADADRICHQLSSSYARTGTIPEAVSTVYGDFLSSNMSEKFCFNELEIVRTGVFKLRVRAHGITLGHPISHYILVILEDQRRTIEHHVAFEAQHYGLTTREQEVWLLRRMNYSYQEISQELYISLDTVKKHLKNISIKRRLYSTLDELT